MIYVDSLPENEQGWANKLAKRKKQTLEMIKNKYPHLLYNEKIDLSNYKIKQTEGESKIKKWQEYAYEICKEFCINKETFIITDKNGKERWTTTNYPAIIFRHARNNLSYLQGKVELAREKFNGDVQDKGRYLIKLFSKKKPWEK